jgi:hypothetical protein
LSVDDHVVTGVWVGVSGDVGPLPGGYAVVDRIRYAHADLEGGKGEMGAHASARRAAGAVIPYHFLQVARVIDLEGGASAGDDVGVAGGEVAVSSGVADVVVASVVAGGRHDG